jgi:hypothetical protein
MMDDKADRALQCGWYSAGVVGPGWVRVRFAIWAIFKSKLGF